MKKKIFAVAIAAIMIVTAVASLSLAYLQDSDYDMNVMTVGNVQIVQNERDRYGSEKTYDGSDKLLPAVYPKGKDTLSYDGTSYLGGKIWDASVNNEVDKFVTVTNEGTESAYIRTIFAFEDKELDNGKYLTEQIHTLWNLNGAVNKKDGVDWPMSNNEYLWITVNGVQYTVCVYVYEAPIASKETTNASLCQLFLDPSADNSFMEAIGEKYDILVLSQAVQSAGFENLGAEYALNEAFGEVSVANTEEVQKWFVEYATPATQD